ncbi:MAG TPA: flagellar export protein FliJ, partial [Burkholderiaceae bacterium]|nr:flagellar export protein FliJ [Burkholderiaceae bacterium]
MTDLQPLTILLGQSERQRDAALAEHQRAQLASDAAAAQAEQLRTYRREYEQRWSAQFARRGQIELVHCYQSFMERLTQAVEQQARMAELAAQRLAHALAALRSAEMRCASVRKMIERRVLEQRAATERREQKQTDEAATRAAWVRIGAT